MIKLFIDTDDGYSFCRDEIGDLYGGLSEARSQVVQTLAQMMQSVVIKSDIHLTSAIIRDDDNNIIGKYVLSIDIAEGITVRKTELSI